MNTIKTVLYGIALLFALSLSSVVGKKAFHAYADSRPDKLQATLDQAASIFSQSLPKTLENGLSFDRVSSPGNRTLVYEYSFFERLASQIDATSAKQKAYPLLLSGLCNDPGQKDWLNSGVTTIYLYRDKTGVEVLRVSFKKGDCDK